MSDFYRNAANKIDNYSESHGYWQAAYRASKSRMSAETRSFCTLAVRTNVLLMAAFIICISICNGTSNYGYRYVAIWGPYLLVYVTTMIFGLIFSFSQGKWLFMLMNLLIVAVCMVIAFAFGDGSGANGGITSIWQAVGLAIAVIFIFTPLLVKGSAK